jgi:hypothetical protein
MNSVKILLNSSNNENIRFDIETNKRSINKKSRLIYLPNKPSYHYDENCKYLNSDYHNYDIPLEIKDEDIEKYREFFLENIDLFNDYPDRFYARVEIKFRTKIRNINTLDSKNTGITKISKYEHIELINKIKSELDEIKSDSYKDFINNIYIPYMKVIEIQKKSEKNQKDIIVLKLNDLKFKMRNHIIELLILDAFEDEMKFKEDTIKLLGATVCRHCGYNK